MQGSMSDIDISIEFIKLNLKSCVTHHVSVHELHLHYCRLTKWLEANSVEPLNIEWSQ